MSWFLRIAERLAMWLRSRREARELAHAARLDAIRYEVTALRAHLTSYALLGHEGHARIDRLDELLARRELR